MSIKSWVKKHKPAFTDFILFKEITGTIVFGALFLYSHLSNVGMFILKRFMADNAASPYTGAALNVFFLLLALEAALLFFFYVYRSYDRYKKSEFLNPHLFYLRETIAFSENEKMGQYTYKETVEVRALVDGTSSYRTRFDWDGSERDFKYRAFDIAGPNKKNRLGMAEVLPDDHQRIGQVYAVSFNNMKKGEVKKIEVEFYDLGDALGKMSNFLYRSSDSKTGEMYLSASFNENKVFEVKVCSRYEESQKPLDGYPRHLDGASVKKQAIWPVHEDRKVKRGETYFLIWKNISYTA